MHLHEKLTHSGESGGKSPQPHLDPVDRMGPMRLDIYRNIINKLGRSAFPIASNTPGTGLTWKGARLTTFALCSWAGYVCK